MEFTEVLDNPVVSGNTFVFGSIVKYLFKKSDRILCNRFMLAKPLFLYKYEDNRNKPLHVSHDASILEQLCEHVKMLINI